MFSLLFGRDRIDSVALAGLLRKEFMSHSSPFSYQDM